MYLKRMYFITQVCYYTLWFSLCSLLKLLLTFVVPMLIKAPMSVLDTMVVQDVSSHILSMFSTKGLFIWLGKFLVKQSIKSNNWFSFSNFTFDWPIGAEFGIQQVVLDRALDCFRGHQVKVIISKNRQMVSS